MTAYDIVFTGELVEGFELDAVKARFARTFQLSVDKVDAIFSHPFVVLRRNIAGPDAERYLELLAKAGVRADMRPAAGTSAAEPPVQAPAVADRADAAPKPADVRFEFNGSGGEFFRIWIVNVLLTVVTLGIYSAWAKVRTERYFYSNTRLAGGAFEYLANPVTILKGRLIAVAVFVAITLAPPPIAVPLMLLLVLTMPWLITRSLAFRARNSSWRNVRFGFDGGVGQAYLAFLVWPLIGALTLGVLMPIAMHRQQRFIIGNTRYGQTPFEYDATGGDYMSALFKLFLIMFGGLILVGIVGGVASQAIPFLGFLIPLAMIALYLWAIAAFNVALANLRYGYTEVAGYRLIGNYRVGSFARLFFTNSLLTALTLGIFYPWAKVRNARYKSEHVGFDAAGDLDGFVAGEQKAASAIGEEIGEVFDVEFGI